jgi:hypothetical protein
MSAAIDLYFIKGVWGNGNLSYMGRPSSDKRVSYNRIGFFRLANHKNVERLGMIDTIRMLFRIGGLT